MRHSLNSGTKRPGLIKRWFPKRHRRVKVLLIIVGSLIAIRLALPFIVLYIVNQRLAKVPGYYGHVEDVDIALFRGAYVLDEIYLDHVDSLTQERTPFLSALRVDLSIDWAELFKGMLVGEVEADSFVVVFTKDRMEPSQVKEDKNLLVDLGKSFMPLRLNRVELKNSSVHYLDLTRKPNLDIQLTALHLLAQNLRTEKDTALLPSTLMAKASLYGGTLLFHAKMDLLTDDPTFDMNFQVTGMDLPQLNDFFQAYAKLDVNRGTFGVFMEAASRDGALTGYVKPVMKDLDVLGPEDRNDNLPRKLWEGFVGSVGFVFTNQKEDQFATKIPFSGTLKEPDTDIWVAIYEVVRNAFFHALQSSLDNEINIDSVELDTEGKNKLKTLFQKKDKGDKANDKKAEREKARIKKKKERELDRDKAPTPKKSEKTPDKPKSAGKGS